MKNIDEEDKFWLRLAFKESEYSKAKRLKVGTVLVYQSLLPDNRLITKHKASYNHMPDFMDQEVCEDETNIITGGFENTNIKEFLVTKPELIHAEEDVIIKAHVRCIDATIYVTDSPCMHCAKLIWNAGIKRVVYCRPYRLTDGIDFLKKAGIEVVQIPLEELA